MIRIGIVDYSEDIIRVLADSIGITDGMVVDGTACSGDEAIDLVRQKEPDVIITEIVLSGSLDGLEVIKRVRELGVRTKVIVLTFLTNPEVHRLALEYGAVRVFEKPYNLQDLLGAVLRVAGHPVVPPRKRHPLALTTAEMWILRVAWWVVLTRFILGPHNAAFLANPALVISHNAVLMISLYIAVLLPYKVTLGLAGLLGYLQWFPFNRVPPEMVDAWRALPFIAGFVLLIRQGDARRQPHEEP